WKSWPQQRLDRAPLVHRPIPLRYLIQRQRQIEDFSGIDLSRPYQVDQVGEESPRRRGPTVQADVRVEQLLATEFDTVRHAHVADRPTGACRMDRLHHRLLRPDAL